MLSVCRGVMRVDQKQTMAISQNQASDLELRILKALFLLKWAPQFKSTPRNIASLLITLERQSYLQRNGEVYEFLTDKDKGVDQEIKRVEVCDSQVMREPPPGQ